MNKISKNRFLFYRIVLVVSLSMTFGVFVAVGNYIVPLVALIIVMFSMWRLKKKSNVRLSDERVEKIGGIAARWTLSILILLMVFIGTPLIALGKNDPALYFAGNLVSLSAMFALLCYSVIFYFINRRGE